MAKMDRRTSDGIRTRREGDVLIVVNDDPATRNALSGVFYDGFHKVLEMARVDASIAAIALTGAGGFFCSGGNVHGLREKTRMNEAGRRDGVEKLHALIRAMRACPKPIIAAIEGGAAGAGASLALACDMIVAARGAYFSIAYVKIGLTPDGGATAFLSQVLPRHLVTELCLTGNRIDVERLHQLGVVSALTEPDRALDAALGMARILAAGPEQAMARCKALVGAAQSNDLETQLDLEAQSMAEALGAAEASEGIAAFLEKRSPDFRRLRGG